MTGLLRRVAVGALATWIVGACASEGFPPGGPEDHTPPVLIASDPAERAVNAEPGQSIRLEFDEDLDDRQEREIARLVILNPDDPETEVELGKRSVTLTPQGPLRDGMTYAVTVLPGLRDLEGNATTVQRTILFSVGGSSITLSVVRATILVDSLPVPGALYRLENREHGYAYTGVADSQGQVAMEAVAYGAYVATAWDEKTRPDGWQMTEEAGARDTFQIGPGERAHEATYRIAVVDTTAPLVLRVETTESRIFDVRFDDALMGPDPPARSAVHLYEAGIDLPADTQLDTIPPAVVRGVRVAVESVAVVGPTQIQIVPAAPLVNGAVYRMELVGHENVAGLPSSAEGGRTFRASFVGPRVFRAEPVPWPEDLP